MKVFRHPEPGLFGSVPDEDKPQRVTVSFKVRACDVEPVVAQVLEVVGPLEITNE